MKKQPESSGFGIVLVLVVLAAAALLGVAGWYVYHTAHKKTTPATVHTSPKTTAKAPVDPTADWKIYSSAAGQYTFRYPKGWSMAEHPELCTEGLVLLAPSEQSVGVCASEQTGEIYVASFAGDLREQEKLPGGDYPAVDQTSVTAAGVQGVRYSGTTRSPASPDYGVGALPENTKTVRYVFYTNNRTYVINYNQQPAYPDALTDFELIVTKTFTFSS